MPPTRPARGTGAGSLARLPALLVTDEGKGDTAVEPEPGLAEQAN